MYFKKRFRTHHTHEVGKIFAWLALTTGLGSAAFWTIFPLVTEEVLGSEALVGVFFAMVSFITLLGSLFSTVILRHISRIKIMKWSLLGCVIFFSLLAFAETIFHVGALEIPRALFTLMVGIVLSLYVRDTAKKSQIGLAEGRYYLYSNIGWLIGPLLGGFLSEIIGRNMIFLFSAALYLISLLLFLHQHLVKKHILLVHSKEEKTFTELFSNIKDYFRKKELRKVFLISFGSNYWWAISGIYVPIYIFNNGFGDDIIGLVIAGGMIPLIFLEEVIGKLADKHGLRVYLAIGFFLLALITFLFHAVTIVPIVLMLMAVVNIGAAFIEPLQEAYLFKEIEKKDEEKFYGVYNASDPIANVIGPLIGAGLVSLWGLSGLWIGSAVILVGFMGIALTIKKKN